METSRSTDMFQKVDPKFMCCLHYLLHSIGLLTFLQDFDLKRVFILCSLKKIFFSEYLLAQKERH